MIPAPASVLAPSPRTVFAAAALLLAAVGIWVVFSAMRFTTDSGWVTHTTSNLARLEELALLERSAIAAQRGYLLSGDEALREQFWQARGRIPEHLAQLRANVRDAQSARDVAALAPLVDRRLDLAARTVSVHDKQGLAAAQAFILRNGSFALDAQIRATTARVRARETALLAMRRTKSDRSASLMLLAAALGIPVSLLMLAMVNRMLVREAAERRRAAHQAEESAAGFRKLSAEMTGLSRFAGMLQSCQGRDELLAVTAQALAALAPELAGTVYLLRASRDHAEAAAQWGTHAAPGDAHPEPTACWAVRRHRPFTCDDIATDVACQHVHPPGRNGTAATACLPLSAQGELLGWLYLSRAGKGPLAELDLMLQAAEQLSLALANVSLREELRNQSIRDPLTGLYNRRYLEESLAREVARCTRRQLPLTVLIFDLDHFKAFNDRHGHPGGDALLSAFGRLLQGLCRPEDIPCRFGGEEFTLILPEADGAIGVQRAQAILSATAQMVVTHQGQPLGRVTTSIGLATLPAHGNSATALLAAADKALYRAKAEGRNRVVVAE